MLINLPEFYENCIEIGTFSEQNQELLNKIMNITSPMKFGSDFATDEELDALEQELDRIYSRNPNIERFRELLINLRPIKASGSVFI